jgi:hypothetical protein
VSKLSLTTVLEPSPVYLLSEICALFEVPISLVCSRVRAAQVQRGDGGYLVPPDFYEEVTVFVRRGDLRGPGWRGLRRPDEC